MKFDEPHFHSESAARALIESVRWPSGPVCPLRRGDQGEKSPSIRMRT
jgi:hypothetical protein